MKSKGNNNKQVLKVVTTKTLQPPTRYHSADMCLAAVTQLHHNSFGQIASSMVLARFKWDQSPNVQHFVRVIQINHDSTIDMLACHIKQLVGSTSGFGKFTASVLTDKD
jgi:hypothetical protein